MSLYFLFPLFPNFTFRERHTVELFFSNLERCLQLRIVFSANVQVGKDGFRIISLETLHSVSVLVFQLLQFLDGLLLVLSLVLLRLGGLLDTARFANQEELGVGVVKMLGLSADPAQSSESIEDSEERKSLVMVLQPDE